MLFTQPSFLFLFLPLLLAIYFALPSRGMSRNVLLLAASTLFYATGAGSFTWLILGLIAFNYAAARAVDQRRDGRAGRWILRAAIAADLTVLAIFKYADFTVRNVNTLWAALGRSVFPLPHVLLPIGISFFTFHAISYVVDVYRRDATAQKRPIEAGLYLLLFPQLIAGPIIRYREIADQLQTRVVVPTGFAAGVKRFVVGLAKKVLVANVVAVPADAIFGMPTAELTAAHAWLGAICYTLQIYFDFSGYSDMAIGLGAMFGFRFPENFNYPYIATSVQDFWRRWHMSLSRWFRDYVYVPLGGNRVSAGRTYVNLIAVFFLCGLWHGASWTFVAWGLYHGVFLVIERLRRRNAASAPSGVAHVYTLLVVTVGWVFFRAETFGQAAGFLRAMAGLGLGRPTAFDPSYYLDPRTVAALAVGLIGATPRPAGIARRLTALAPVPGLLEPAAVALLFAISVMFIAASSYNPFIYFRF
ncbi:MAG TPA: MBOAT family protein [Vicinamibacterales bacterium]|nr:MBOAT family protein [Vicinamibacterales bacterium]